MKLKTILILILFMVCAYSGSAVPEISFVYPTPDNASTNTTGSISINTSLVGTTNGTSLINWEDSLVGWWRMNEAAGGTNIEDFSPTGYNGTWYGNATSNVTTGKFGNGLDFDGINDAWTTLPIGLGTEHTISLWLDFNDTDGVIYGKDGIPGYALYVDSQSLYYNPGDGYVYVNHSGLTPGTFYHIVIVRDGLLVTFYKDNVKLEETQTLSANTALTGLTTVGMYGSGYFPSKMRLDELTLFNRAISEVEIGSLYSSGSNYMNISIGSLVDGEYSFVAYVQNSSGIVNNTETRYVTVSIPDQPLGNCTDVGSDGILDNIVLVGSSGTNCTTDGLSDNLQIQAALDNASNKTVLLQAGTYNLEGVIRTPSNTVLLGNSSDRTDVVIDNAWGIQISGNDSDLENITIMNMTVNDIDAYPISIQYYGSSVNASNITLDNIWMKGHFKVGIEGYDRWTNYLTVKNSEFNKQVLTSYTHITLYENNMFRNAGGEIGLDMQEHQNNIVVRNNTFYNNQQGLRYYVGGGGNENIQVYDNEIYGNERFGVQWKGYSNSILRNNSIHNNGDGGNQASGLLIFAPYAMNGNTVSGNRIYNNNGDGIVFSYDSPTDVTFTGNFTNNVIYGNAYHGINVPDNYSGNVNINVKNNIIVNNSGYGIYYYDLNAVVNLSYNDVWNNSAGEYYNISGGVGNISSNPLFNSTTDFHLKSQYGRYYQGAWVYDAVTSPAIDAGDINSSYSLEPEPNGDRINMGSYGNTVFASKSYEALPSGNVTLTQINTSVNTGGGCIVDEITYIELETQTEYTYTCSAGSGQANASVGVKYGEAVWMNSTGSIDIERVWG